MSRSILLGRYRVLRKLGQGGFGSVVLAEDLELDNLKVAVKVSHGVLAGAEGAVEAVKQEALLAMKLSHPNIVTLRAFETDGDVTCLVLDFVQGESLQERISRESAISAAEVRRIFQPLAEALQYAHTQGVIHRDLKPANILISEDSVSKLADFGIARILETAKLRQSTGVLGTLPFMSPQQLAGESPQVMHDIYGFGATMYTCLTGHPPFYKGDIAAQIVHKLPDPPHIDDRGLKSIIMRLLGKSEERRPRSMGEVAVALQGEVRPRTVVRGYDAVPKPNRSFPASATSVPPDRWFGAEAGAFSLQLVGADGKMDSTYDHHLGTSLLAVESGSEFNIRLTNRSKNRVVAILSVDGLSVFRREPASFDSRGYVIMPDKSTLVPGWRLGDDRIQRFKFVSSSEGEAAEAGSDPRSVGTVACAIFQERQTEPRRRHSKPDTSVRFSLAAPEDRDLAVGRGTVHVWKPKTVAFDRSSTVPSVVLTLRYVSSQEGEKLGVNVGKGRPSQDREEDPALAHQASELDSDGYSPFHYVVLEGDIDEARRLICAGVDVNHRAKPEKYRSVHGSGSLLLAAANGDAAMVSLLVRSGAHLEAQTADRQDRPLHRCFAGKGAGDANVIETAQRLVGYGADVTSRNSLGHTPLHFAAAYCSPTVIWELLQYGALKTINWKDHEGDTTVDCAEEENAYINAEFLRSCGGAGKRPGTIDCFDFAEAYACSWNEHNFNRLSPWLRDDVEYDSTGIGKRIGGKSALLEYFGDSDRKLSSTNSTAVRAEMGFVSTAEGRQASVIHYFGDSLEPSTIVLFEEEDGLISSISQTPISKFNRGYSLSGWEPTWT